jgi:HTH-type transcriptional regulator/antitoxin HipB
MHQIVAFNTPQELGALIRAVRTTHGYSQNEAANELGITQRYLSEIERGEPKIFDQRFLLVLMALGIKLQASVDTL